MHFMTTITVFTSAVAAFTLKGWRKPQVAQLKVSEAQEICGQDTSVRCCNNKGGNGNNNNQGGFLGLSSTNLNLFNNCVDLSLNVVGILDGTLGRKCSGNVVCCRDFPFADITGPINDGRPCIELSNLL
ncbi:hydrophobin [Fusarium sp. NRRL 25303]|nr:hydrophobin [Fusarium sp. NRRL 25303]